MMTERPAKLIDPVCGMTVDVAAAEAAGLLLEYDGRTWAFCRAGCMRAFVADPQEYVVAAEAADSGADDGHQHDAGSGHSHDAADGHPHDAAGGHPAGTAAEARPLPVIDEGMRRWYESCSCCLSETYPEIRAALDAERAAAARSEAEAAPPVGICEVAEGEAQAPAATPA
jgi:YHS domain-containing protein